MNLKYIRKRYFITAILIILFSLVSQVYAASPKVAFHLIYSPECEDCQTVRETTIPLMQIDYNLEIHEVNVDENDNYLLLRELEKVYGLKNVTVPVIVMGKDVIFGAEEVKGEFENLIKKHQAAGGVELTSLPEFKPVKVEVGKQPIYGIYFFKTGCAKCSRLFYDLKTVKKQYPMLELKNLDISLHENIVIAEALGNSLNVPKEKRLVAPAIYIGKDYLISDIKLDELIGMAGKYKDTGAPKIWEMKKETAEAAHEEIVERFSALALTTIFTAGLLDGINPCAFATIIFLVSYLSFIGRSRKEILAVGASFTLAVFLTYFLVGLGLLKSIQHLSFMPMLGRIVYILTGGFALVLGVISFLDYLKCLKGKTSDMQLQLPKFLKQRIHKVIREKSKTSSYVIGSFVTGMTISLLELACTGQVYLPTIIYVTKVPGMKWHAIAYLLMYNLLFVSPLVLIFLLVYYGITSDDLSKFMMRHTAAVKFATSVLFLGLGAVLLLSI